MKKTLRRLALGALILSSFNNISYAQKWVDMSRDPDANFYEVVKEGEDYFANRFKGKGSGYKQFQRWVAENKLRVNKRGHIVNSSEIQSEISRYQRLASGKRTAAVPSMNWVELGPNNEISGPHGMVGAGRVESIALHPTDENIIYAAAVEGGVWKTTNGGTTWIPTMDNMPSLSTTGVSVSKSTPTTLYASLASGFVYKSTDAAATWQSVYSGSNVRRVIINPTNANKVVIATYNGVLYSNDGGVSWANSNVSQTVYDIEFKTDNPNIVYAAANDGVYKSIDAGVTFNKIALTTVGETRIAVTPANPNYVYVAQANSESGLQSIFRSTDAGATFVKQLAASGAQNNNYFGYNTSENWGIAWWGMAINVSQTNANEVYIGCVNHYKSTDGGLTFALTTYNVHSDVHDILTTASGKLYSSNDGGVFTSTNGGSSFNFIGSGLRIRQFYRIAVSPVNGNNIAGGAQDMGSTNYTTAQGWVNSTGGDGEEVAYDAVNPNIFYTTYQNTSGVNRYDASNNTYTWLGGPSGPAEWTAPKVADPNIGGIIYSGSDDLYKYDGYNWNKILDFTTPEAMNANAIAVAQSNSNYIYAYKDGKIYSTSNGGSTWNNYSISFGFTNMRVSPNNPSRVYVSSWGGVYVSENAGATFTQISGVLPSINYTGLAIQKGTEDIIYIGGANGNLFFKKYSASDWTLINQGLPSVAINDLEINTITSKLLVGTYARGIYQGDLQGGSSNITCTEPAYNATTAYNGGQKVSYNGKIYTANWWTQGAQPDVNSGPVGTGKPWTETGTCQVQNVAPVITITSPTEGQVLSVAAGQKVNFTVSTTPSVVDSVKYILVDVVCNGPGCTTVRRFTQTTAPYSLSVDPIAGAVSSQVNVVAFKNGIASEVSPSVNYTVVQPIKPVVTINAPVENQEQYFYPSDNNKVNVALGFNIAPSTIDSVRLVVVELLCNGPGCANVRKYTLTNATTFNLSYLPSLRNNGYTEIYAVAFSKGLVSDEVKRIFYAKPLPELTIVSPANNSSVSRSISSLLIDVNVNTTNLAIDSVIYLVSDAVVNGQFGSTTERKFVVTSGSFDLTLPVLTGKTFTRITALAFGDGGKNSRAVSTQVNYNDAPVVTITAPTVGSKFNVGGSVTVSANVTDDGNVSQVEIYSPHIPNSTVTLTAAPYTATFTNLASSGNRFLTTFIVKATDNQGAVTVQTIDVAENRLPVIAVTAPLAVNGINPKYKVGYPVTVSANVSDQDGTIKKVVFTLPKTGETIVDSILPYSVTFANLPAPYADGTLYFTVTAFDNNNATSATNVIVYKNRVPSATITSPVANATFNTNANITVTALPYDPDFTSGKIEYFVNGSSKIGEQIINSVLTAGTQYSVNFNNVPNGIYDFTARITDDMGEYAYSPAVRVEVKTPNVTCTAPVYNPATAYTGGQSVQYNGIKYTANWWTQGAQPDLNNGAVGTGKPWTSNGTCTTRTGDNVVIAAATSIYPNPTSGLFTIETETETSALILNAFGKEVATLSLVKGQNEVNLSLSSGVYFVKINNNVTKLVIE